MARNDKLLRPLSFGRGIANRVDETAVPMPDTREGTPGAARVAVNTDLPSEDRPRRRQGWSTVLLEAGTHSLWSCDALDFGLYAAGGSLKTWIPGQTGVAIATLTSTAAVHYVYASQRVWWSNGRDSGCVRLDGTAEAWGVPTPEGWTAAPSAVGGLTGGRYQITLAYRSARGEEGGAAVPVFVQVPEGGGITLGGLQAPSGVQQIRVYVSAGRSEELRHAQDLAVGGSGALIGAHQPRRSLDTQLMLRPMPPCTHLVATRGRIFGAQGRFTFWTEALRPGLYNPRGNVWPWPRPVTMMAAPVTEGFALFVATASKTYLLRGTEPQDAAFDVVGRGAQPGTLAMVPGDALGFESAAPVPVWIDGDGQFVAGTPGGVTVLNKLAVAPTLRDAAAAFIDTPGLRRYMAGGRKGRDARLSMGDRVTATVVHHGEQP